MTLFVPTCIDIYRIIFKSIIDELKNMFVH